MIIVAVLPARPAMTLDELEAKKSKDLINPRYYEMKKAELLAARTHRECPHCKEQMRRDASVCPHCQRDSQAWTLNEGYWWYQRDDGWLYLDGLGHVARRAAAVGRQRDPCLRQRGLQQDLIPANTHGVPHRRRQKKRRRGDSLGPSERHPGPVDASLHLLVAQAHLAADLTAWELTGGGR